MQLKLRVGIGDTLTIDVQPADTFKDLSDRVFQITGVQVDLSQLKSNDKPFNMSTNVVDYFSPKLDSDRQKLPKLCRLCSRAISHDPHYIFDKNSGISAAEKINACLPLHVTMRDQLPKQICTICLKGLNVNYEFMKKVLAAQKSLENVFLLKNKSFPSNECCPLCVVGQFSKVENKNGAVTNIKREMVTIAKDSMRVPHHVHDATTLVNSSNIILEESVIPKKEFYLNDEVVTGYWDGNTTVSHVSSPKIEMIKIFGGTKRYRKRNREEDDSEWTIDEEYVPVSRRGRPKGTKNKPKVAASLNEKSCAICGWLGPETDMLGHVLNHHCQPDMGYFPCPLCKINQSNEAILENHLVTHNCSDTYSI